MFIPGHIRETSNRTGTLHVHLQFGKSRIYAAAETVVRARLKLQSDIPNYSPYHSVERYHLEATLAIWYLASRIEFEVCLEPFTVQALYAGLLVAPWTTAQKIPQRRWSCLAQLAIFLVFLATLTIVGRWYASHDAAAPLAQFHPRPYNNSKHPTSNLVLDRLFIPNRFVKSDTRVIREYSKVLFNRILTRTKREFESPAHTNRISNFQSKLPSSAGSFRNHNVRLSSNTSTSDSGVVNKTRVTANDTTEEHQNDSNFQEQKDRGGDLRSTERPMPPAHAQDNESAGAVSIFGIILVVILVTGTVLGIVTCLLSHQWGTGGASGPGTPPTHPHNAHDSPTTAPMLSVVSASSNVAASAGMGGMDRLRGGGAGRTSAAARELAHARDRQARLRAVRHDIAIDLPHSIAMPDGEDHPFDPRTRLHLRDPEQESEIYGKCIRPPPNRTVLESESPPPYRSSSAGVLPSSSSSSYSGSDWSSGSGPLVVRCHSMSSSSKPASHSQQQSASAAAQKTDFLQRTVKIFTGGKKTTTIPPPTNTTQQLPVVIVPTLASSRTSRGAAQSRHKQPPQPPPAV